MQPSSSLKRRSTSPSALRSNPPEEDPNKTTYDERHFCDKFLKSNPSEGKYKVDVGRWIEAQAKVREHPPHASVHLIGKVRDHPSHASVHLIRKVRDHSPMRVSPRRGPKPNFLLVCVGG